MDNQQAMHVLPVSEELRAAVFGQQAAYNNAQLDGTLPAYPNFVDALFKQLDHVEYHKVVALLDKLKDEDGMVDAEHAGAAFASLTSPDSSAIHAAIGCAGEGGELLDCVKKVWIYGKRWDQFDPKTNDTPLENLLEELADYRFYYQKLLNMLGVTDAQIQAWNVKKLVKRYATLTYSDAQAQGRADKVVDGTSTRRFFGSQANVLSQDSPLTGERLHVLPPGDVPIDGGRRRDDVKLVDDGAMTEGSEV